MVIDLLVELPTDPLKTGLPELPLGNTLSQYSLAPLTDVQRIVTLLVLLRLKIDLFAGDINEGGLTFCTCKVKDFVLYDPHPTVDSYVDWLYPDGTCLIARIPQMYSPDE